IAAPAMTQAYIASAGLPAPMLAYAATIAVEVGGGVLLLIGYQARIVALALAAFTLVAAVAFHANFGDQNQMIHFLKNVAIAGGGAAAGRGVGRRRVERRGPAPQGRTLKCSRLSGGASFLEDPLPGATA